MATTTKNGTKPVAIGPQVEASDTISMERFQVIESAFNISGTSSLICNQWSPKVRREMLDKHMKKAPKAQEAKDPQQDFLDSLYVLPDWQQEESGLRYGFPTIAFKAAMVRAGTYVGFKMTYLRGAFRIDGELIPIKGDPAIREDMVRLQGSKPDIRFRAEFSPWGAVIPVRHNESAISVEQIAKILEIAGFSVGVGEWRPEKNGQHGCWEIN
jgi:hypothetical protein